MNTNVELHRQVAYFTDRNAGQFLVLLVAADAAFIALHTAWHLFSHHGNILFSLTTDRGYAEIYQYVKEFWIVLLLLWVLIATRQLGYIAWAVLFAFLLCDDAASIHERGGRMIADRFSFPPTFGLRPLDLGELVVTAIAAAVLFALVGAFYLRGGTLYKQVSRDLLLLLLGLAFFGIAVDMLHSLVSRSSRADLVCGTLEDGGEMVVISVIAWYVHLLAIHNGQAHGSLCSLARTALSARSV